MDRVWLAAVAAVVVGIGCDGDRNPAPPRATYEPACVPVEDGGVPIAFDCVSDDGMRLERGTYTVGCVLEDGTVAEPDELAARCIAAGDGGAHPVPLCEGGGMTFPGLATCCRADAPGCEPP